MSSRIPYQHELESNFRIAYLIANDIRQNLSEEEEFELEAWIMEDDDHLQMYEELTADDKMYEFAQWFETRETERSLEEIKRRIHFTPHAKRFPFWKYAAVLMLLGGIGLGLYYLFNSPSKEEGIVDVPMTNDIAPGISNAVLKLPDGRKIDLTSIKDTSITGQVYINDGTINYDKEDIETNVHEIRTPKKSFYQFVLPDGSRVWLNSMSSIRYPSRFTGSERRVSVTGETYFEIAKDPTHPFIVDVNGIDVRAIGTKFNINAYPDETGIRMTLTEGSVQIKAGERSKLLAPGQQLLAYQDSWRIQSVDISSVTGWVDNEFRLKEATIQEVMRMVARWYDVKIVYEDKVNEHFTGIIDRDVPASQLLKVLEATGDVNFRIQRDSIIVTR